ncbi:MAG: prepilin-type N-terminal cleavage/methylation domain-containing protein [Verrucomicrobia bacterium]|nr:prepilin-type N-terminal cleavage/methylation domain-containing protein [Verrucomicrobiota bacterium]MCH8514607.1 prepilin-type N-terminal cleavage/methylation domain-containing protein [Kiritimatiellia bacterium]
MKTRNQTSSFFGKPPRKTSTRSGFTLPEVVITSLIIVLMMLPLSRLAFTTISRTRYARDVGDVVAVGQQKLEQFADMEYENIVSGNEVVDGYTLRWVVTPVSGQEAKLVQLEVSWQILSRDLSLDFNNVYTR